jgi:hypothetical protein
MEPGRSGEQFFRQIDKAIVRSINDKEDRLLFHSLFSFDVG